MKKFAFKLQKLLELRQFEEDKAKAVLAQAIGVAEGLKAELRQIAEDRVATNASRSGLADPVTMQAIERYIIRLDTRKEQALQELAQAELVVEEKRAILAEAVKQRKILEKLRENKYAEWKKERQKEDDKILDDIVTAKAAALRTTL